jgi:Fur family zinc uptake transcriptional regulator
MRTPSEIQEIERRAAAYCQQRTLRMTEGRAKVLRQVAGSRRPVKAYDLIASSAVDGKNPMPPRVYRALDFWTAHGFMHRIESLNAYTCCTHPGCGHECQLFVCSVCGRVYELYSESLSKELLHQAARQGFEVDHSRVEMTGRCPDCR